MLGQYYLLCVGTKNKKYQQANLIGLHPKDLKDKKSSISWMKIGQGEHDDYRFAKRIKRTTFECVDTKEIFEITERGCFTVEAWERFLTEVKVMTLNEYAKIIGYDKENPTLKDIQEFAEDELDWTIWDYPIEEYGHALKEVHNNNPDELVLVNTDIGLRFCEK